MPGKDGRTARQERPLLLSINFPVPKEKRPLLREGGNGNSSLVFAVWPADN